MLRINMMSVYVKDQDRALHFYTDVLGFCKRVDIPLGEYRWLTVVSSAAPDGTELLLEPDAHPAVFRARPLRSTTRMRNTNDWMGSVLGSRRCPRM